MDEREIEKLLQELGMELPDTEEPDEEAPLSFDDLGEEGRERKPRDWRAEWEREPDDEEWD